uniref:Dynamin-like GTPase OPA1, mitochondrial n=1 Tax=Globodera rostochiensis TaxID=31243 RepID=A0A914HYZ0_GLORO
MASLLRHILKIRYWILGGAVGGGITVGNWLDKFKESVPNLQWIDKLKESMPTPANWLDKFKDTVPVMHIDFQRVHKEPSVSDEAGISESYRNNNSSKSSLLSYIAEKLPGKSVSDDENGAKDNNFAELSETQRAQKLQEDLLRTQLQYQRELELLEKENKNLKQRLLLKDAGELKRQKKIKRSLIELYSEMLDILIEFDSSYGTADNLPRVVVVGDQSAGKTSHRSNEGPYHVAQFRDSNREFDLTNASELEQLRNEIELRMRNSVRDGKTVSNEVISLTVKGPALPRMVLVDLPGVISTVTTDMARDTKDDIAKICKQHMENPNAIILCIQDGSVDAERSNVTDLVTNVDPDGQRTILVLTKVDLAEKNLSNPHRIKKILDGKLFPMKALGYFGVVTEFQTLQRWCFESHSNDDEEHVNGGFGLFLANEWKNTFTHQRDLSRDELFDKARGEVLDEVVNLSLVSADEWEVLLRAHLWNAIAPQVFDQILMPASTVESTSSFNTVVDIKLKHWAEKELANKSVQIGWETLSQIFRRQVEGGEKGGLPLKGSRTHGHHKSADGADLLKGLKNAVVDTVLEQHTWDSKALDYLRVIQLNAVADQVVPDRRAWDLSCAFLTKAASDRIRELKKTLGESRGPSGWSRWFGWSSLTPEQLVNQAVQDELSAILTNNPEHKQTLLDDDLTVIRRNLETRQLPVNVGANELSAELIRQQWRLIYRNHFLERMLQAGRDCQSFYQNYKQAVRSEDSDLDCQAVVFFYRINRMLELSCNALRQQIVNTEQRRLQKEVKEVLNDWSSDVEKKKRYLTGRQVELAEELGHVRFIQEKLEEFIVQLHQEKPCQKKPEMASSLTVKIHPVVYMSIVDAYERKSSSNITSRNLNSRPMETAENRALGTLLGFYEKNVVQVTSCYAVPFRETSDDIPEINDALNRQMWQMSKRTSPSEQIVGW